MALFQNQLQFNLDVPPVTTNLAARFHRPNPIMLERAGGPPLISTPAVNNGDFQFSSVSEERMSMAMKLAQRDLKKKKMEAQMNQNQPLPSSPTRTRSPSPKASKTRTKIIHGKEYWDRFKKHPGKSRRELPIKERDKNLAPKTAQTQTPPKIQENKRVPDPNLPATTNSPPTRDTDLYPVVRLPPSTEPAKEIERLQREMESYLQQIQIIEQRAMREQNTDFLQPSKSRKKDGYLSDEEDSFRKTVRSDEQVVRSARQLYNLRQQVRDIQSELLRIGPDKMKHTKKSQAVTRLAAAHRGAVRAIQVFVNQLHHQDLRRGLPTTYHELALLIRQLSMLSTQLKVDGTSSVPEDLVKMLDRVDELNKAWCSDVMDRTVDSEARDDSPSRRRKSPVTRRLFEQDEDGRGRQMKQQMMQRGKENRPKGVLKKPVSRTVPGRSKQAIQGTPDRRAALRAGLAALLRADQPPAQQRGAGVAWSVPVESNSNHPGGPRGLILPGKLQAKRQKIQKSSMHVVPLTHFADPTVASNLKAVSPLRNPITEEVAERSFSAPSSPRRDTSQERDEQSPWRHGGVRTPNSAKHRTRSVSPRGNRGNFLVRDVDQDLVKQLFPDQDGAQGAGVRFRGQSPQRPTSYSRSLGPSNRLVDDAEVAIRHRLQPLLDQARDVADRQERLLEMSQQSLRNKLANQGSKQVEVNADVLSDMILHDILRDTAGELQRLDHDEACRRDAVSMQDAPTLENVFQRLEQMELEQLDIRRRWGGVEFGEEEPVSRSLIQPRVIQSEDRPSQPAALHISRHGAQQGGASQQNRAFTHTRGDGPIIFTKVKPASQWTEQRGPLLVQDEDGEMVSGETGMKQPRTDISLPQNVADRIHENRDKYDRYLKKMSHHAAGRFDPWNLMEEIADHIIQECFRDISAELEEMSTGIVNHVCKSEFTVSSHQEVPPSSPLPQPVPSVESENRFKRTVEFNEEVRRSVELHEDGEFEEQARRTVDLSNTYKKTVGFETKPQRTVQFDEDVDYDDQSHGSEGSDDDEEDISELQDDQDDGDDLEQVSPEESFGAISYETSPDD